MAVSNMTVTTTNGLTSAGPDPLTLLLAAATVIEALALVLILAFGEDSLHRFLSSQDPRSVGTRRLSTLPRH
jgi:hypothetical protein